ncbi:acyl-CoA dehydrogenase family protein [Alcaligenes sp. SDU_A2]|uniref:acyl-CoA dehydrogenase family protein n=1 Tax=Alcaligenes sp. SDU_A2 TaxID=3136634 RepID=UPI0031201800
MGSVLTMVSGEQGDAAALRLSDGLALWLQENALALDTTAALAQDVLPRLAAEGVLRLGLKEDGSDFGDAVRSVVAVAEHSLTAAFVLWGQRTFIEYLRHVQDPALRERYLPGLLDGRVAGATGLSNAIKFLGGIEGLQLQAQPVGDQWQIQGRLPWVTNLRRDSFVVAVVAGMPDGQVGVWAFEHGDAGLARSEDLALVGLRSSSTAALTFADVRVGQERLLHADAAQFVAAVRPRFLALQCGMTIGLARRSLHLVLQAPRRQWVQEQPARQLLARVEQLTRTLIGAACQPGTVPPPDLFRLRIELSALAAQAVALESSVTGGAAYLEGQHPHLLRRYREALFVPLISPTVAQLRAELGPQA